VSLHRLPVRKLNSISEALRSVENHPNGTKKMYNHDTASWRTARDDPGRIPENAIKVDTAFVLDDLEFGCKRETDKEWKVSDNV